MAWSTLLLLGWFRVFAELWGYAERHDGQVSYHLFPPLGAVR